MKKSALRDPEDRVIQGREALLGREDVLLTAENPWPGLVSFSETNQAFFFGRDQEIADLARLITQETLTVLFGKSGLGKSSILNAGLAPVLRKSEFVPIYIRLDYSEDAPALAEQIKARIEETLDAEKIDAPRPGLAESLWEYFHTKGRDWWDHDNRLVKPVLICDQFEELLTIGQDTPARAARTHEFLTQLEDLIDNRIPAGLQKRLEAERGLAKDYDLGHVAYRIVLSLREDFLADLESLHDRLRPVMRNRFRLLPMSGEQAMDVILKPGARLVDEDVAVRIVDFVSSSERSRLRKTLARKDISGRQVEPALLSVVLRELNNRRCHSGRDKITADLVGEGQAAEILQAFYERGLSDMDEHVGEFVVDYLLTSSGARNRVAEEDALARPGITPQVIATLIDRRIIQRQSSGNVKWLELSHDTLADVVRAHRAEYRQRREVAAAAARAAEAHRNLMRSRRLVAAFASLALLAGIGLVWAIFSTVKANRSAQTASHMNLRLAESNRKLGEQQAQLEGTNRRLEHQGLALKEAAEALKERDDKFRSDAEEQADKILTSFRQEIADLKPDAGPRVLAELEHLADYASHFDSVRSRYALGKALGAELLYSYGYMHQGLDAAKEAVRLTEALPNGGRANEEPRVIRAAASYALGRGEMEEGRLDKAEGHLREALGLVKNPPSSSAKAIQADAERIHALAQMAIGDVNFIRYSMKEAREEYNQLLAWLARDSQTSDTVLIFCHVRTLQQLAGTEEQYHQASVNFDGALRLVRKMMTEHPDNLSWRSQFVELADRYALKMMDSGRSPEAARLLLEAEPIANNVYNLDRSNLRSRYILAFVKRGLGTFYQTSGNKDKARTSFQEIVNLTKPIYDGQRSWVANRYLNGVAHYYMGQLAGQEDKEKEYIECRRVLDVLAADAPTPEYLRAAALAYVQVGILRSGAKDYDGAIQNCQRARAMIDRIPARTRAELHFQDTLAYVHTSLGYYGYLPLDRREDARSAYQEAIRIYREAIRGSPTPDTYNSLANARQELGDSYLQEGAYNTAASAFQQSIAAYDEGLSRFSQNPELLGPLVIQKANMVFYFAKQWRVKMQLKPAVAALRVAVETARAGLKTDLLQSELHGLLDKAEKEGAGLKTLIPRSAADEKSDGAESLQEVVKELDATIAAAKDGKILWPEGAKGSADKSILEVERSQPWEIPPLIPGTWFTLAKGEQDAEVRRLAEGDTSQKKVIPEVLRMRALPLAFYDNAMLYEAEVRRAGKSPGVFDYVRTSKATLVVDGTSPPIHEFNRKKESLRLETPQQAVEYLHFFTAAIGGGGGEQFSNFRIVDGPADLLLPPTVAPAEREKIRRIIVPMQVRQTADGKWDAKVTLRYSNLLFYAILHVDNFDGNVSMTTDQPIAVDQPLITEHFVGGLRVTSDYNFRTHQLKERAERLSKAKQWSGAVQAQRNLIKLVRESELMNAEGRAKELPDDFLVLAWYQLHAKDFSGALASTEEGLKLEPAKIVLDTNRAHALLFLGRTQEAEDVYRKHLGEKTSQGPWEKVILNDLKVLEQDGLSHPGFARIREMMSVPK
jgi:tetratricopeptide (TPR) repeat protein